MSIIYERNKQDGKGPFSRVVVTEAARPVHHWCLVTKLLRQLAENAKASVIGYRSLRWYANDCKVDPAILQVSARYERLGPTRNEIYSVYRN